MGSSNIPPGVSESAGIHEALWCQVCERSEHLGSDGKLRYAVPSHLCTSMMCFSTPKKDVLNAKLVIVIHGLIEDVFELALVVCSLFLSPILHAFEVIILSMR